MSDEISKETWQKHMNALAEMIGEVGEFKPGVFYNKELRLTEILLRDCFAVWCPWGPFEGHAVDCGYDENGDLVGIKIWDDVRKRPERPS